MSHNYQHKKRNSSDSSDSSSSSSESEKYERGQHYDQCRAWIICPPYDHKEKYDSSESDSSCPDFSDLCENKPRINVEKKKSKYEDSSSSDESSDDEYYNSKSKKCHGCDRTCGKCNNCRSCACRECSDYSRSSVVKSLGSSDSDKHCDNFDRLVLDEKRKNIPLYDHCKPDDSSKDASCEKKSVSPKKYNRKVQRKQPVKSSSSDASSSGSRGKKFVVSFGPKEGHQWAEYNEGDSSIHINGKNGPVLHLYRGSTYFFCVEQSHLNDDDASCDSEHFFFLTNSPIGGAGSRAIHGGFAPVSKGCVCFKVDKSTPRYFFYQSSKHTFEGGLVIVHDK